jgi:glycosyltransferase involved in cell wall biosynthesis
MCPAEIPTVTREANPSDSSFSAPTVSVVVPVHNKVREVSRALRSILCQCQSDFEVVVVNDGSTDGSERAITAFRDNRIRLISQGNAGEGAARNRGIREAKGSIVAFCDADDEWMPGFLETVLSLERAFPHCAVFATEYVCREPNGRDLVPTRACLQEGPSAGVLRDYFDVASTSGTPWCSSSVAVRRDAMLAIGGFPTNVRIGADSLAWARLASRYEIAISRSPRAIFHLRGSYPTRPVRIPDVPDVVGKELAIMAALASGNRRRVLRRYLSTWHRMRAAVFIYHGHRAAALGELRIAVRNSPRQTKLYILVVLALIPGPIREAALGAAGRWKSRRVGARQGSSPPEH